MFERYTEEARRSVFYARFEAGRAGSGSIETEHLLLGLIREARGVLAQYLADDQIDEAQKKAEGQRPSESRVSGSVDLPLSLESKRVLAYGSDHATNGNKSIIEPLHLLVGLLREENCSAARILVQCGLDPTAVRSAAISDPKEDN